MLCSLLWNAGKLPTCSSVIDEQPLQVVPLVPLDKPVRYLGIELADTLADTIKHTLAKIDQISCMKSANMISAFCHPWNLKLKALLVNSYLVSKLYYPAQVLPFPKSVTTTLSRVWGRCLSPFHLGALTGSIQQGGVGIRPPFDTCLTLLHKTYLRCQSVYPPLVVQRNLYLKLLSQKMVLLGKSLDLSEEQILESSTKQLQELVMAPRLQNTPSRQPTTCVQLRCKSFSMPHHEAIYTNLELLRTKWPAHLHHWVWKFQRRLNMVSSFQEISCMCSGKLSPKHCITCQHFEHKIERALYRFNPDLHSLTLTQQQSLWERWLHLSEYEDLTLAFWACMKMLFEAMVHGSSITDSKIDLEISKLY